MASSKALLPVRPRALLVAASTLALTSAAALADGSPAAPFTIAPRSEAAAPLPPDTVLKRLPAGASELTFRGELSSRRFSVVLGRGEVSRVTSFQVALYNTVSALPEHSAVTVAVNGRTLATLPANAADKPVMVPIAIPAGLLVPGANAVEVTATLTHRVDCSVPATYELWAKLDPTRTGFVVPRSAADPVNTLADLAAAPLAEDGTTRIHVRLDDEATETDAQQAAQAVQAVVKRANLVRPVVDVGPGPGTGAGFDLVVGNHGIADGTTTAKTDGIVIGHDPASGRVIVAVDPETPVDAHAKAAREAASDVPLPGDGFHKTFGELGRTTEVFTGRRYEATIPVSLPADFMGTNERAHLRLDGQHAATLIDGDGLSLRVNGTLVSYLPLAAGRAESFDHRDVELPLRFFHPGRNEVTIEGTLSAEADAQCKTATMPREARLTIADTSELQFPSFAHLTTIPRIPVALTANRVLPLYLPSDDNGALESGLTMLANMAAEGGAMLQPRLQFGASEASVPGIVVAPVNRLPADVIEGLRGIAHAAAPAATATAGTDTPATAASQPKPNRPDLRVATETLRTALRNRGFFFGSDRDNGLALGSSDVLVAALTPGGKAPRSAFDVMPRFTQDPTHWLVLTAADSATLKAGLKELTASGRWDELRGEATRFDPTNDTITVREPHNVTYVLTSQIAASDIRPVLGGLMSDNILMSLVVLFVVMGALGLSTHAVVRRMGVK